MDNQTTTTNKTPTDSSSLPTDSNQEVGYVIQSRESVVFLDGLPSVHINDMVESSNGVRGWVNALHHNKVEVLLLDDATVIPGEIFKKSPSRLGLSVGQFLLSRAINPIGVPIDGKGPLAKTKTDSLMELEQVAPGIDQRQFITTQFDTGITVIDSLIPLGKGQRELVMGDAHSGKTGFLIDLIINQKQTGVICIYACIGKTTTYVKNMLDILKTNEALTNTVVIAASSSEPAPLIFLTPKTAFTVAEFFQKQGKDVLVILDDMGNHAKIHREISLLGNKNPGKESYPGDIFYQHAHLLERAGNFKAEHGGGSITALPVIELNLNDFTTLIPTNLMSMTDGHLLFRLELRNQGQRPAIDVSLSVSRVGRQTQDRIQNSLSEVLRQLMSQALEVETVSRFGTELPYQTQLILRRKQLLDEMLKQDPLTSIPKSIQSILLSLVFTSFLAEKDKHFIDKYKNTLIDAFLNNPEFSKVTQMIPNLQNDLELINTLEAIVPKLKILCPE